MNTALGTGISACLVFVLALQAVGSGCSFVSLKCVGVVDPGCCEPGESAPCICEDYTETCCLRWDPATAAGCNSCVWTNDAGSNQCSQWPRNTIDSRYKREDCITTGYLSGNDCTCTWNSAGPWFYAKKPCDESCS